MKKITALFLTLALSLLCFTACGKKEEYTVRVGVAETVDYESGIIRQTVAGVLTDKGGNVVLTRLDAIEYEIAAKDGEILVYVPVALRDKDNNTDFINAADYLEGYTANKTVNEVAELTGDMLGENVNEYTADLIRAISKALNSEYPTTFKSVPDLTSGVSLFAYAEADNEKHTLTLGVSYAAIAAADGKVMGAVIDENELTVTLDPEGGEISSHQYVGTKLEQGENYHMDDYNPEAVGEWYEQAAAYVKTVYYKPVDRIDEIPEGTTAGCTIETANYHAAIIKASRRVR